MPSHHVSLIQVQHFNYNVLNQKRQNFKVASAAMAEMESKSHHHLKFPLIIRQRSNKNPD